MPEDYGIQLNDSKTTEMEASVYVAFRERMSDRLSKVYALLHPEEEVERKTLSPSKEESRVY